MLSIVQTLGELREGVAALHRAMEAATRSNIEMVSQQSSRIDRQVEKLDAITERVADSEKKIDSNNSRINELTDNIKIRLNEQAEKIKGLEGWKSGQSGAWGLIKSVMPWVLAIATIMIAYYENTDSQHQDNDNQSSIIANHYV